MADVEIIVNGQPVGLGLLPTPASDRAKCASFPFPVFAESEWYPIDRRQAFGPETITNQKSTSACVGFSTAGALSVVRAVRGHPFVALSGPYLYSLINHGSDNGAMIYDALEAIKTMGCATLSQCPLPNIYRAQTKVFDDTAAHYKSDLAFRCDTPEEAASAILKGAMLVFGVTVGRKFNSLDAEGVVGIDDGYANHAVRADGLYHSTKWGWCLEGLNSWSASWGMNGRFRFPLSRLDEVRSQELFGIASTVAPKKP